MAADDVIIIESKELVAVQVPAAPELVAAGAQGPAGTFSPTAGTGLVAVNGVGGYLARTLVSLTAALAITNANGVAGNPTLALVGTTAADYGITDVYTKTASDARFAPIAVPWASITGVPTTVAGYGITDVYTKTQSDARFAPIAVPWNTITGTPTTATGYGIASIDNVPIGATTASTGAFTTLSATGLSLGQPSGGAATLNVVQVSAVAPVTATGNFYGYRSLINSAAAAFTIGNIVHFFAESTTAGVGSAITNARGFYAANAIARGTNNYGFYSDIANAANTWAFYASGTARSYFAGPVGIWGVSTPDTSNNAIVVIGWGGSHPSTGTSAHGLYMANYAPSTATALSASFYSAFSTQNAVFTLSNMVHFYAAQTLNGASATITKVYGFWASNNIAGSSTNTYGFYSDIADATNTWQLYMGGTAISYFGGPVCIFTTSSGGALLYAGGGVVHPATAATIYGYNLNFVGPSTATSIRGFDSSLASSAAAYTVAAMYHFIAEVTSLGAGSTITNTYGFFAANAIAVGVNNYGFYSSINSAANTYQLYMGGTAPSLFGGAVIEKEITETYSASITPNALLGNERVVTVTNTTAFTINAPTNPATGQYLELTIRNASGGVMGAITWDAVFKMTAFTNPANGFSRTIIFRYNGTNWVEKGRTAADIPN